MAGTFQFRPVTFRFYQPDWLVEEGKKLNTRLVIVWQAKFNNLLITYLFIFLCHSWPLVTQYLSHLTEVHIFVLFLQLRTLFIKKQGVSEMENIINKSWLTFNDYSCSYTAYKVNNCIVFLLCKEWCYICWYWLYCWIKFSF